MPEDFEADAGLEALLKRFGGEEEGQSANSATESTVEADTSSEGTEGTEAAAEGAEGSSEAAEEHFADDDHLVAIGEGEATRKLSVRELKELATREEAIRERDTATAAALERATQEGDRAVTLINTALGKAQKEFAIFADLDKPGGWVQARTRLSDEAFQQLQNDYTAARNNVLFFQQEGNRFVAQVRDSRSQLHTKALGERDAILEKDAGITGGWSKAKADVVAYAKEQGLPEGVVDTITHPAAIRMMWKAMAFDRGAAKAASTVKPVATSASKTTLKPGAKGPAKDAAADKLNKARATLRETGSLDAAEAAFMARFSR